MNKEYSSPLFTLIRQDESDKMFFAASGTPGTPALGGSLGSISKTNVSW